jgi:hypothetical protein
MKEVQRERKRLKAVNATNVSRSFDSFQVDPASVITPPSNRGVDAEYNLPTSPTSGLREQLRFRNGATVGHFLNA